MTRDAEVSVPDLLRLSRRLHSIAQAGLTYAQDPYDLERYRELTRLAAELLAAQTGVPFAQTWPVLSLEEGYATPKVDVRAVVFDQHRVLLTRERQDGLWSLPGGWADIGESPAEMAARETFEETGFQVRPVKLLAVLDKGKHDHPPDFWAVYKLFVRCELLGGAPQRPALPDNPETSEARFFAEGDLPPLSTGRVTRGQLARMFEHWRQPELATDFD